VGILPKKIGGEKKEKMNEKKVSVGVGISVLFVLVALVSASSVIYASQEAGVYVKSDLPAAQSNKET
jgi:hypothetical protein